jgi:hypothetical protein
MKKILLGFGFASYRKLIQRRSSEGVAGFLSPRSLIGALALNAAGELLSRLSKKAPAPKTDSNA